MLVTWHAEKLRNVFGCVEGFREVVNPVRGFVHESIIP
jgi:hypothetical protein